MVYSDITPAPHEYFDYSASRDAALDAATDPAAVNSTVNPDTARVFKVGDFIVFSDEAADANDPGRRSYECAQITVAA